MKKMIIFVIICVMAVSLSASAFAATDLLGVVTDAIEEYPISAFIIWK